MGLRIARRDARPRLRQFDGARDVPPELRIQFGRGLAQLDLRPAERSEVVVDRDRAAHEQHVQPQHRRERAMSRGVRGVLRDRLAQAGDGLVVIEVVGERKGLAPERRGIGGASAGRGAETAAINSSATTPARAGWYCFICL